MTKKNTFHISSKGQITIPKKIRDVFKTNMVSVDLIDDTHAIITPFKDDAAGVLKTYQKPYMPFEQMREECWKKEMKKRV